MINSFHGSSKLSVPHTAIPSQASVEVIPHPHQVQALPRRHRQLLLHPLHHVKIVHRDGMTATESSTIVIGTHRITTVKPMVIHTRTSAKQPMKHAVHVEVVKMAEEETHQHHPQVQVPVLQVRSSSRLRSTPITMDLLTIFSE